MPKIWRIVEVSGSIKFKVRMEEDGGKLVKEIERTFDDVDKAKAEVQEWKAAEVRVQQRPS
jgi:hypothetical protein